MGNETAPPPSLVTPPIKFGLTVNIHIKGFVPSVQPNDEPHSTDTSTIFEFAGIGLTFRKDQ